MFPITFSFLTHTKNTSDINISPLPKVSCMKLLVSLFLTMRKLSSSSSTSKTSNVTQQQLPTKNHHNNNKEIEWELRPGGMLVQKRDSGDNSSGPVIKIIVSHGSLHHHLTVPAHSTFGDLKKMLAQETGLEPKEQRLLFRGKEKEDVECLDMAGVKDSSKIVLLQDPASKERKLEEMNHNQVILKAYEQVAKVRSEVDKLSEKAVALEGNVRYGTKVAEKEILVLTELLMVQLLKLDSIEADGEAKVQRKIEVKRVQRLVDMLDSLKSRNVNPLCNNNNNNAVSVTTKWETFESGVGSLNAPSSVLSSSTRITHDWELFD